MSAEAVKKRIAVITGASSGMGRRFAQTADVPGEPLDEIWVIARRADRLAELEAPFPVRALPMDLTDRSSFGIYGAALAEEQPDVRLLINCSGFGKFDASFDEELCTNLNMLDLNCAALMAMCQLTEPYMSRGARIVNIASVAAFQPIPYINVYAATKAFVLSFSRGLSRELRGRGISVTAVCPFWTQTEFFDRAVAKDKEPVVKKYTAMYSPEQIVRRAWRDVLRGRDVSRFGFVARAQAALAKHLPHRLVMSFWMRQQRLK